MPVGQEQQLLTDFGVDQADSAGMARLGMRDHAPRTMRSQLLG
jgi:hypothetical protein